MQPALTRCCSPIWPAALLVLGLSACATTTQSQGAGEVYTAEQRQQIERCRSTAVDDPRVLADEPAELRGGLIQLQYHLRYPPEAREISGRVIVQFTVTEDGQVADPEVLQAPHEALGQSALEAICLSTFVPARHHGQPVAYRMSLPIQFQRLDFDILIEEPS